MKSHKICMVIVCTVVLFVAFANFSFAEVPSLLNYEGRLTDKDGNAVPNGTYEVQFSIYDVPADGAPLWSEMWDVATSPVVSVNGVFNAMLGSHTPIPEDFFYDHPVVYLGIKVGNDSEMMPRQRIGSVAFAMNAGYGGVPRGGILMWSGAANAIPKGWALCDGSNNTPDLRDRFIVGAGGTYGVKATGGSNTSNLSHTHSINAESPGTNGAGNHVHNLSAQFGVDFNSGDAKDKVEKHDGSDTEYVCSEGHIHTINVNTSEGGMHSHMVNSHAHGGNTGDGLDGVENRPPYFALCFIMKL